jgi:hypothetical protein
VVTATGAYQRLRLEEYADQVKAKNSLIKDIKRATESSFRRTTTLRRMSMS